MELTLAQEKILRGEKGESLAKYMQWMVGWGNAMQAHRLVPVENALPNGMSAPGRDGIAFWLSDRIGDLIGDVSESDFQAFLEERTEIFSRPPACTVYTHIGTLDLEQPHRIEIDERRVKLQRQLLELAGRSGWILSWTCAPYLIGNVPVKGQICAWTESHAVVYINSILGARSTRHGCESAVAAAVLGLTPEFGVLTDRGRKGDFLVEVKTDLIDVADWGALGYFAGQIAGLRNPVFTGINKVNLEQAIQLCAALATGGGVSMFHMVGITPEAPTLDAAFQGDKPEERYIFGKKELQQVYEELSKVSGNDVDFVYIGCPHCTLQQMAEVAVYLRERRVAEGVTFILSTPFALMMQGRRLGFVETIEKAGGYVMVDTCPAVTIWPRKKRMVTNSVKQAYYSCGVLGNESILTP
ncbi:MAG: aconitase X catalytic domain-containing protein, partial [Thermodesulfobacteriota bacterium]